MQYTVVCSHCSKRYAPTGEQLAWIERAARDDYRFIMIECEKCSISIGFNPQHPEGYLPPEPTHLCCPIETCSGLVVQLPDHYPVSERLFPEATYGCGECGNEWASKEDIYRAITTIIVKYPYRAGCYIRDGEGWQPVEYDQLPDNYHALVEVERANVRDR